MSRILVDNPVTEQFAMIPNGVWDLDCSIKAKALLAYLLSFHHMSAPSVAQIESVFKIGKKARLAAMSELAKLGFIRWQYDHDAKGRIVSSTLCVTSRPLLVGMVEKVAFDRKRQKGANGETPKAPFRPRVGAKKAPIGGQKGAIKEQDKYKEGPAALNLDLKEKEPDLSVLSSFQISCLWAGRPMPLGGGRELKPSDARYVRFAQLLRKTGGEA